MKLLVFLCVSALCVHSFPIGTQLNSSEEVETSSVETADNESQETNLEEQLNEVAEESSRKKRGMYSSERTEEEVEVHNGMHHRMRRHAEHHENVQSTNHGASMKRSAEHHREKRSEGHPHEKRSVAKDDHHGAPMKRSSDHGHVKRSTTEEHHHEKRNAPEEHHHEKRNAPEENHHEKRNAPEEHHHEKRSEHVTPAHHEKRNAPEGPAGGEHHVEKRSGDGHRHHRSTDQGLDEAEPEDEILPDEEEESTTEESRSRRDAPLPSFPSDHEANSNSVAVRVKRVSRAGSSHKVRTLNKNRGNSKLGETTQNDSPPSGVLSP